MVEADFCRDIRKRLGLAGAWAYKIPDMPRFSGQKDLRPIVRPFDIAACWEGRLVAIEVKRLLGYQAFGLRHMRNSQEEHLTEVAASGARAFVFLVVWEPRTIKRLLIFPWETFPRNDTIKKRELEAWPYVELLDWDAQQWLRDIGPCSFDVMSAGAERTPVWMCSRHFQSTVSAERPIRCTGVS